MAWFESCRRASIARVIGVLAVVFARGAVAQVFVSPDAAFTPATIAAGGTTNARISLSASGGIGGNSASTHVTITRTFLFSNGGTGDPNNLTVLSQTNVNSTNCSGSNINYQPSGHSIEVPQGLGWSSSFFLTARCQLDMQVTSLVPGVYTFTIGEGAISTDRGPTVGVATATLVVTGPRLATSFSPTSISPGGTSTLTLTLSNADTAPAVLSSNLVDTLPANLTVVAGTAATTCTGGAGVSATPTAITLASGAVIPAQGNCAVTASVTSSTIATLTNLLPANSLTTDIGSFLEATSAQLLVQGVSPTLSMSFSPGAVDLGAGSTLTTEASNPNAVVATLTAPLTVSLPTGMAAAGAATVTCSAPPSPARAPSPMGVGGGTVTLAATGATIPANGSCRYALPVTTSSTGNLTATIPPQTLQTDVGTVVSATSAVLVVNGTSPSVALQFAPATIAVGQSSTLTATLGNPNALATTTTSPTSFSLPTGLRIDGVAATTNCGAALSAPLGGTTVSLAAGATLPGLGSCAITLSVRGDQAGEYTVSIPVGGLATGLGSNTAATNAVLVVNGVVAATAVPILAWWGVVTLIAAMMFLGLLAQRRP